MKYAFVSWFAFMISIFLKNLIYDIVLGAYLLGSNLRLTFRRAQVTQVFALVPRAALST